MESVLSVTETEYWRDQQGRRGSRARDQEHLHTASIRFILTTGPAQAWAYYPGGDHQYARISSDVYTADPAVNNTNVWFDFGGYGNTTLIHELATRWG